MSNPMLQIIVLGAIAVFLILKLRGVLGTRDGFEPTRLPDPATRTPALPDAAPPPAEDEIADHVDPASPAAGALAAMKRAEPSFAVGDFLSGARQAYEMILTAFEKGDLTEVRPFLAPAVAEAFDGVIADRRARGLTGQAQYLGTRETQLANAAFDPATGMGEVTVRFVGELIAAQKDADGVVVDGDEKAARKQRDIWTFARRMGAADPNWQLIATA